MVWGGVGQAAGKGMTGAPGSPLGVGIGVVVVVAVAVRV